jgi:hypothetical protein
MSILESGLAHAGLYADPCQFDKIRQSLPPSMVEEALSSAAVQDQRRGGRLPVAATVGLVIAMALYRPLSIEDVVVRLRLARPGKRTAVAPSAIPQARDRLGHLPMQRLFEMHATAEAHASAGHPEHRWRGLGLYGMDGTSLRTADSPENRAHFGGHSAGSARGPSGYPLVRVVGLMALCSHLLAAIRFDTWSASERFLTRELWSCIPDWSLTIVDRLFLCAADLIGLHREGTQRHWLCRAKSNTRWTVLEQYGPGDWLVEMQVSPEARRKDPTLPRVWRARAIRYHRRGFRPQILLTSLLDPEAYPAAELVALYHKRWELELGWDEIKTHMLDNQWTLRSKHPIGVKQEIWGISIAYNLVRLEMQRVAIEAGVEPTCISFLRVLGLLRDELFWWAVTEGRPLPPYLRALLEELDRLVLRPRRPERRFPRAVKIKMSNFPRKRPTTCPPSPPGAVVENPSDSERKVA